MIHINTFCGKRKERLTLGQKVRRILSAKRIKTNRCREHSLCYSCKGKYHKRCRDYHLNDKLYIVYNNYRNYLDQYYKGFLYEIYSRHEEQIVKESINHAELALRTEYETLYKINEDEGHAYYKLKLNRGILYHEDKESYIYKSCFFKLLIYHIIKRELECSINIRLEVRKITNKYNLEIKSDALNLQDETDNLTKQISDKYSLDIQDNQLFFYSDLYSSRFSYYGKNLLRLNIKYRLNRDPSYFRVFDNEYDLHKYEISNKYSFNSFDSKPEYIDTCPDDIYQFDNNEQLFYELEKDYGNSDISSYLNIIKPQSGCTLKNTYYY